MAEIIEDDDEYTAFDDFETNARLESSFEMKSVHQQKDFTSTPVHTEFVFYASRDTPQLSLMNIGLFCDLSLFNMKSLGQAKTAETSPLLMLFSFYGRICERLKLMQDMGAKVAKEATGRLFDPLVGKAFGIFEIFTFCKDFKIFPTYVGKCQLQCLWRDVQGDIRVKVGFENFLKFLVHLADFMFRGDRWATATLRGRVERFLNHFGLKNPKILRNRLIDLFRDTHIGNLSLFEDFHESSKFVSNDLKKKVKTRNIEKIVSETSSQFIDALRVLTNLSNHQAQWELYRTLALDLGLVIRNDQCNIIPGYKIQILNRCHQVGLVDVHVETVRGQDPLQLQWQAFKPIPPGFTCVVQIGVGAAPLGEWWGWIVVSLRLSGGKRETCRIPAYCRILNYGDPALPSIGLPALSRPTSSSLHRYSLHRLDPTSTTNLVEVRPGEPLITHTRPVSAFSQLRRPLTAIDQRSNITLPVLKTHRPATATLT